MLIIPRGGQIAGTLAFFFIQKLEAHHALEPGETRRIWAEIASELKDNGRDVALEAANAIDAYGLAK